MLQMASRRNLWVFEAFAASGDHISMYVKLCIRQEVDSTLSRVLIKSVKSLGSCCASSYGA
jgi:hypothetical protein